MTIVLTKAAYERYRAIHPASGLDAAGLTASLQEASDRGDGGLLDWMGKPAVYLHNMYWLYEASQAGQEMTLLDCCGMLQSFMPLRMGNRMRSA